MLSQRSRAATPPRWINDSISAVPTSDQGTSVVESRLSPRSWCRKAPIHQLKSLKLSSPCSRVRAPTMSSMIAARRLRESKSLAHAESVSGVTAETSPLHASISSRRCLMVMTSVRCRMVPNLPASSLINSIVSASPRRVHSPNTTPSWSSMQNCLRAIR